MTIPHSITDNSISVLVDYRMRVVPKSSINFGALRDELKKKSPDIKRIKSLVDIPTFVARVTIGAIRISADEVYFKNEKVGGYAATRLLAHLEAGDKIEPLAKLLEKLMANPESSIREDLWRWMENANLPIAEDGDIIAFKKVQEDYFSYHKDVSGKGRTFCHKIGAVLSMPREDCDKNRRNACSTGLHFCSYGYLPSYYGNQGRVVIVKLDPADITSFPTDNTQKGRACRYEVIGEVPQEEARQFFSYAPNVVSSVGTYTEPEHDDPEGSWDGETDGEIDPEFGTEPEDNGETASDETRQEAAAALDNPVKIMIGGKTFGTQRVLDLVASLGQRGTAKKLGVPRTSLQDALKRLN